jgi:hypothetical protein
LLAKNGWTADTLKSLVEEAKKDEEAFEKKLKH